MNARLSRLALIGLAIVLIPNITSAYYAAHMGRWTSRDPYGQIGRVRSETVSGFQANAAFLSRDRLDPTAEYHDGMNLYEYVQSDPVSTSDPFGLIGAHAGNRPASPSNPIGPVTPLPSNSPECDKYSCDDYYAGAEAKCFCKCAGDSPWSNYVRGCLRMLYEQHVPPAEAHRRCYQAADGSSFPGGRPWLTLAYCWAKCADYASVAPPVEEHPLPTW